MHDFRGLLGGKSEARGEAFIRETASHNIEIKRAFRLLSLKTAMLLKRMYLEKQESEVDH